MATPIATFSKDEADELFKRLAAIPEGIPLTAEEFATVMAGTAGGATLTTALFTTPKCVVPDKLAMETEWRRAVTNRTKGDAEALHYFDSYVAAWGDPERAYEAAVTEWLCE